MPEHANFYLDPRDGSAYFRGPGLRHRGPVHWGRICTELLLPGRGRRKNASGRSKQEVRLERAGLHRSGRHPVGWNDRRYYDGGEPEPVQSEFHHLGELFPGEVPVLHVGVWGHGMTRCRAMINTAAIHSTAVLPGELLISLEGRTDETVLTAATLQSPGISQRRSSVRGVIEAPTINATYLGIYPSSPSENGAFSIHAAVNDSTPEVFRIEYNGTGGGSPTVEITSGAAGHLYVNPPMTHFEESVQFSGDVDFTSATITGAFATIRIKLYHSRLIVTSLSAPGQMRARYSPLKSLLKEQTGGASIRISI